MSPPTPLGIDGLGCLISLHGVKTLGYDFYLHLKTKLRAFSQLTTFFITTIQPKKISHLR